MNPNARVRSLTFLLMLACASSACQRAPAPAPSVPAPAIGATPTTPPPSEAAAGQPSASPPAASSEYSALAGADCELLSRDVEAGGSSRRCPGVGGYRLIVQDSDARMSLQVQPAQGAPQPLELWQLAAGAFSGLGERAEWRLDGDGEPAALIVRYNAYQQPEQPDRATSYLVIAKLKPAACMVDVVPPGPDQNARARIAADAAAGKPCRTPSGG